jgi:hypothetical protein
VVSALDHVRRVAAVDGCILVGIVPAMAVRTFGANLCPGDWATLQAGHVAVDASPSVISASATRFVGVGFLFCNVRPCGPVAKV